ncbi:MAG TPA: hypothetical protein VFZ65_00170 [Planctomycetota bacterium]|nr:hypothetical protein [Planctomycetota bacterium]
MTDRPRFWLLTALHLGIALIYRHVFGVGIEPDPGIWQILPTDLLAARPVESIWNMHSQPPLFNALRAVLVNAFGDAALDRLHDVHMVLGALMCGMVYVVAREIVRRRWLAFVAALAVALHPSLFLYEAYELYTLVSAFLVVAVLMCLARHRRSQRRVWLYGFVLCLDLLVLTRSVFHPLLLLLAVPSACVLAGPRWRRVLVVTAALSCVSLGWYAKNELQYGTFSGSSWGGLCLFRVASYKWSPQELAALAASGEIAPAVASLRAFSRPSAYVPFGFDRTSPVPALSRDDFHNINVVALSSMYGRAALQLIRRRPDRYVATVTQAVRTFCSPSAWYWGVEKNAARIAWHVGLVAGLLEGGWFARLGGAWFPHRGDFGSFVVVLLPLALLLHLWAMVRGCGTSLAAFRHRLRGDAAMSGAWLLIAYTLVVTSCLEYGENNRFRFLVEPVLWPFLVAVAHRVVLRRRAARWSARVRAA